MSPSLPAPPRAPRRLLDGVLLLDKPVGLSSNDALMRAKRLYRAKKAGHTGTLDPLASGLLPLCFGEATKFSQDLLDADKTYEATMRLGIRTASGDAEGDVLAVREVQSDEAAVRAALAAFRGDIAQVPPMYSALKRDGKPLYEYARAGQSVERAARAVTIHALELLACTLPDATIASSNNLSTLAPYGKSAHREVPGRCKGLNRKCSSDATNDVTSDATHDAASAPSVTFRVTCSKGTYVRTLAEDIGEALGCGAHLTTLRRTGVGALTLEHALTLEQLADADERTLDAWLLPVDTLLSMFSCVRLNADATRRFRHGQRLRLDEPAGQTGVVIPARPAAQSGDDPARVRVYGDDGRLLGVAKIANGVLAPERLVGGADNG